MPSHRLPPESHTAGVAADLRPRLSSLSVFAAHHCRSSGPMRSRAPAPTVCCWPTVIFTASRHHQRYRRRRPTSLLRLPPSQSPSLLAIAAAPALAGEVACLPQAVGSVHAPSRSSSLLPVHRFPAAGSHRHGMPLTSSSSASSSFPPFFFVVIVYVVDAVVVDAVVPCCYYCCSSHRCGLLTAVVVVVVDTVAAIVAFCYCC